MSRTYRRTKTDNWDDGDRPSPPPHSAGRQRRQYATPRYQPGSRRKPRNIVATGVRRDPPDLDKLMRAMAQAALERTAVERTVMEPETEAHDESAGGGLEAGYE